MEVLRGVDFFLYALKCNHSDSVIVTYLLFQIDPLSELKKRCC